MGAIILFIICIFIFILSILSYIVLKRNGYKKLAVIVGLFFTLIVLIPVFSTIFESELYFKSDAEKDLKAADIILTDDFEIEDNEIFGMPDYYQITKLKISDGDRNKIIAKIKNSSNFKVLEKDSGYYNRNMENIESDKIIWNYTIKDDYIIETYKKKAGYSPNKSILRINKHSNIVDLTVIMD